MMLPGKVRFLVAALAVSLPLASAVAAGPDWTQDAACRSGVMAAAGGVMPSNKDVFVMRYMGSSNYELSYRNTVLLFDAQYRRSPPFRPLPVTREQLKRVNAVYVGHGHADHMMDAPFIAEQDAVPMYGAWPTTAAAKLMGLPDKLNITVKSGDVQKYPGFTVEAVLGYHSITREPDGTMNTAFSESREAWAQMKKATGLVLSPQEEARRAAGGVQGSNDGKAILTEGTIAWFITFDDGYRVVILDSSGPVTDQERAKLQQIGGKVDLAIVAYQGFFVAERQIPATLPLVEAFKPDIFLPDHHDQTAGGYPDMAVYPLFMAIQAKLPATRSISPLYGMPICINTRIKGGQAAFVGESWTWPANRTAAK